MEPIPETLEALDELDTNLVDEPLADQPRRAANLAHTIAPDLVGVSIASHAHGVTFTLMASGEEIAALDAVQYLSSGPCVEALDGNGMATTSEDLFSEPRWQALAQAAAASGVRSTLTFPMMNNDRVIGTVNLYGGSDTTFDGKHRLLAVVFNGWAPGAVTNADLSFATRRAAEQAPEVLKANAEIDAATGILAAAAGIDVDTAREQLEDAAARAGVSTERLARLVIDAHFGDD